MERIILHIDMDAFFPAVEERENPQFRGKPIIVGADPKGGKGRGVVSSASYIAREYGIHSALPISRAFKLCPKAVFLPSNIEFYKKVSKSIFNILKKFSPKLEIASLDEAYLDISFLVDSRKSLQESYKKAEDLAKKIKNEILKKEKLASTIGVGPNKLVSKIAAQKGKPDGILVIRPEEIEKFLEPLDVRELPGIGIKTAQKLKRHGISKIKDLKKLSKLNLKEMFGKRGVDFYKKARGIDKEIVSSERVIKSIGKEYTFEEDTRDPETIFEIFDKIIKGVYQEVLENNFYFTTITVICRFRGFETHTKSKTFKEPSNELDFLRKESKKLLLKFIVENPKLIRLIGLRVSGLIYKK